ncbi:hypothetical protein WICMUC_005733 [Wickerhamomyces mucosus]|uniref:OTU domain-containing protein n=1 Tax=Wickerhamomyces mucosus TaxID=1378264 RepID=A0A9P8P2H5_9ASCO|nr:hypothetical protein WICMUC_005733 [Wickerhamomyces mucosus]
MSETEDQILSRHRKENRDLIATITGLKKQATKSKKKEVQKKCLELEQELKEKHESELKTPSDEDGVSNEKDNYGDEEEEEEEELTPEKLLAQLELEQKQKEADQKAQTQQGSQQKQQPKGPKRNRQKERLAKRAALVEEQKEQARQEASLQPNLKEIEQENIDQLCKIAKLKQYDIQPDGNCLFASISDQLKYRQGIEVSIKELRVKATDHIKSDPETFTPYLFDEATMSLKNIDEYCDTIANTAAWGSDLEILALAKEFNSPISIMMSGRSTLKIYEDGANEELKLVYYKHTYALGEHYNSLRDSDET